MIFFKQFYRVLNYSYKEIKAYVFFKPGLCIWFMAFLQLYYMYHVFVTDDMGGFSFSFNSFFSIFFGSYTVALLFHLIVQVCARSRFVRIINCLLLLTLYCLLVSYHFGSQELFDFSVLVDNLTIIFTKQSFGVIFSSLHVEPLYYLVGIIVLFLILEYFKMSISQSVSVRYPSRMIAVFMYLVFVFLPYNSADPIVNFIRSIKHHYTIQQLFEIDQKSVISFDVNRFQSQSFNYKKPHIILIAVESLNASILNKTVESGQPISPFLNGLQDQSVFVEQFYGNSIQTAKGHFSLLFSVIPSLTGKTFVRFKDLKVPSIASVLKSNGYDTHVFSAYKDKKFDNEASFLLNRGFDSYETVDTWIKDEDTLDRVSWGLTDASFYTCFFDYFDTLLKENSTKNQFVFLATIANHFPFNSLKSHQQHLYNPSDGFKQNYMNSAHLSDKGLQVFFDELKKRGLSKDVLVIVTADHAFPMGEHKNFHLEAGYHEESFRIPFFMVWDGHLAPQKIQGAYSQMDIAPTIIDLLDIELDRSPFQGQSIFQTQRLIPIYLVQPYGKYLSVISYPFKYLLHTRTMDEFVYDLKKDPMEEINIIDRISQDTLTTFRDEIKRMFANQGRIKKNQLVTE